MKESKGMTQVITSLCEGVSVGRSVRRSVAAVICWMMLASRLAGKKLLIAKDSSTTQNGSKRMKNGGGKDRSGSSGHGSPCGMVISSF